MIKIMWAAVVGGAGLVLACPVGGLTAGPAWAQPKELPAQVVTLGGPAELYKKGAARVDSRRAPRRAGRG